MGRERKRYESVRNRQRSRSRSPHRPTRPTRSTPITFEFSKPKERKPRSHSSWDIAPPGYEHLSPAQYKLMQASGQIASRIIPDAPPTGESATIATVTRQARRLYVGNIPFSTTNVDMMEFFNEKLQLLFDASAQVGNAILSCQVNLDKNFAFLEFRSMDEATVAMSFDGILYRGQTLKIRRPHDYHPVSFGNNLEQPKARKFNVLESGAEPVVISPLVPDSPHKIYVGGLPICLEDEQVKELLVTFGQLRGFNLVKDTLTGLSKGYAFCEYADPSLTEQAIASLNGMQLGDRKLVVQRSLAGVRNVASTQLPVLQVPGLAAELNSTADDATEVLCLLNMVLAEELQDDEEYEDIRSDIKQECAKYGKVKSLKIPRQSDQKSQSGCGKIYVRFDSVDDCKRALNALSGRKFNGRIVMTSYYDLAKYKRREFR
ncbi:U2af50 [Drosophila busckii]|uniref:Splicing factor U2AF subunit n=1 Tax=Drosophila busckii TaxID=30019 RepID=A0A0M4EJB5_DROBS|nr:splicing factor U2AF 50 kDa subunit [Drosophila busckii]ALC41330.1 U2af50 [Drosophila busckii]